MIKPEDIIILVLSTKYRSYSPFIKACEDTWVKDARNLGFRVFFYEGGCQNISIRENTIKLSANDDLQATAHKLIEALRVVHHKFEYKLIFRTNLSSYIFADILLRFANQLPLSRAYSGVIGHFCDAFWFANNFDILRSLTYKIWPKSFFQFASGSGFWLSRDLVDKLVENEALRLDLIDDVMVGHALHRLGVSIITSPRVELSDSKIICPEDFTSIEFRKNCYHVRLKSSNRNIDVERFYVLNDSNYFNHFDFKGA